MTNFDIPNESELNPYKVYDYDLVDSSYPIEDNQSHGVYDQFLWLRDTLVKSWKKYSWKAGSKLVIWETEDTVEVIWRNRFRLGFNNDYSWNPENVSKDIVWPYVIWDEAMSLEVQTPLCCIINQNGWYRITHKETIATIPSSVTKVYSRVDYYYLEADGRLTNNPIPIAVFDWECSKAVTGTTYWTDPNWTCRIQLSLGSIFNKMVAFGYIEREFKKWERLVLRITDQDDNRLILQDSSNYFNVELTDLVVKKR